MCDAKKQCDGNKQSNRSPHRAVLWKTAISSFAKAVSRMVAVTLSGRGVIYQTAVVNPRGKRGERVLPFNWIFATPFRFPLSRHSIVVSDESTTSSVGTSPQGTSGIMPDQVPANLLEGVGLGDGKTGFALSLVFASPTLFDFGFAVAADFGLGVGSSKIGAGSRCAVARSSAKNR